MGKRLGWLIGALMLISSLAMAQTPAKTRLAIVGLDHDHVWGLLKTIASEQDAALVAIADPHADLIEKAKARVPKSVAFFTDYVQMLEEAKPEAVIVTTANNRHLEILRECAKRKIHFFTEKPMASTGADAREMERLARQAGIKLMVNYWNVWAPATQEAYRKVQGGLIGPVQKIIVQFGHQGPKEIGVSKYFGEWLYDPEKNGAGAMMDFGCYGADWALWLKGRPRRVYAVALTLKPEQKNAVEDEAVIVLEYPDATAILQPSWNWPYSKGEVQLYGPKGSLHVRGDGLLHQPAGKETSEAAPEGTPLATSPLPPEMRNAVAYFLDRIRNNKPLDRPVAPELNVGVNEILDAAKESIRTGRAVDMPAE
jgi:glucose-fructose oxidoreductase